MIAIGGTVGLAEGIIDDTCLVLFMLYKSAQCTYVSRVQLKVIFS